MRAKYVDPFTDFGFKRIFGQEASKPLLRDFLNALLPPTAQIAELTLQNSERPGRSEADRRAIFDVYCRNEKGEQFIVELQKAKQNFFKDRTVFYSTFPIREQGEQGGWSFELKAVYCVGILDFVFNDPPTAGAGEVFHEVKLKNQHGAVFYDKLTYIYLEMPNFRKTEAELTTRLDQWLYFLRHVEEQDAIPILFRDAVFTQAFEVAALAKLTRDEWMDYELSLKYYRDNLNTAAYALEQAVEKAVKEAVEKTTKKIEDKAAKQAAKAAKAAKQAAEQAAKQTAKAIAETAQETEEKTRLNTLRRVAATMRASGLPAAAIEQATGLTPAEIAAL